jgi:putative endonuclease
MCIVYAIQSLSTRRIYIGQTKDLDKRLRYHNLGYVKSTSRNRPWELMAFVRFRTSSEARWAERELKKSSGKRIKWIEQNSLVK